MNCLAMISTIAMFAMGVSAANPDKSDKKQVAKDKKQTDKTAKDTKDGDKDGEDSSDKNSSSSLIAGSMAVFGLIALLTC